MRILLTSNASHDPPRGGSTRSNLVWLERLAAAGHACRVVCASAAGDARTARAARIVRDAAAVVAIGEHMAGYIRRHLGAEAAVIHPPIYGEPPYPRFGAFDTGWILMINPCAVKGVGIFLELARAFPDLPFA